MFEFVRSLDFMGRQFKFNFGEGLGDIYKTLLGGLLCLLQVFGFLVLLWYYGQDIYLRESPSMIISSSLLDYFPRYEINSSIFNFGRMEIIDLANKVFPVPGGPWKKILWPPAAAISKPLLACS